MSDAGQQNLVIWRANWGAALVFIGYNAWKNQDYLFDRMSLRDLVKAYFTDPAIQIYLALVWYVLHRFVLHRAWLYRSQLTAALWKRIHYDHHRRLGRPFLPGINADT